MGHTLKNAQKLKNRGVDFIEDDYVINWNGVHLKMPRSQGGNTIPQTPDSPFVNYF